MITSPIRISRRAGLAAILLAGIAVPAPGQDRPESLLPPGFDDPAPAPAPTQAAPRPAPPAAPSESGVVPEATLDLSNIDMGNVSEADAADVAVDLSQYDLPDIARHSLARVGVLAGGNVPFPATGFGNADGRYLRVLMQRAAAPLASRWASIALRRALMSPANTPANIDGADFAAERAWLLLRMGEAVAARAVVNDVDTDNYTMRLYQVAMQSALASGDPAGLCPLTTRGAELIQQRGWALAHAICAGLAGKPKEGGQLFDAARRGTSASDIDNLLAEKVLGTGAQGRRAVTVEWNGVTQLSAWRWGLATATGVDVPADLYATAGPQVRYWQALSPTLDPAARAQAAELAATAGVFSSAALVDLYSEIEQQGDSGSAGATVARDLRIAHSASDIGDRMEAMQTLWDAAQTPRTRYARLILTARAASWMPANASIEAPERLIASMLSAGLQGPAMAWRGVVKPGSEGWALLALADSAPDARVAYGDFDTYRDAAGGRKAQLLLAGLAGLGRLSAADAQRGAQAVDVQIGGSNSWTRAIDLAGRRGDASLVALLAGVGMQSLSWDYVSPEALFHIVAAMRAAGMGEYARMIAVEAITRA